MIILVFMTNVLGGIVFWLLNRLFLIINFHCLTGCVILIKQTNKLLYIHLNRHDNYINTKWKKSTKVKREVLVSDIELDIL